MATLFLCLVLPLPCIGLPTNILQHLVNELQPKALIYVGDNHDSISIVSVFDESLAVQSIGNWTWAKHIIAQQMPPKSMLLLPIQDPKSLADLWSSSSQQNFVYTTWILVGSSLTIVRQAVMFHIDMNRNGFSPSAAVFFMDENCKDLGSVDCFIIQVVGNGIATPFFKDCGILGQSCNLSRSVQAVANNHNFNGQSILASYTHLSPFCIVHGHGQISGIVPTLARELGKLLNFSMMFVPFRERKSFGKKLSNGTWIGNIGDIHRGLVQTSVSGYAVTADRSEAVEFTPLLTTTIFALFIKRPSANDISAKSYLSQYPLTSWLAVLAMYLLCWLIVIVIFYYQAKKKMPETGVHSVVVSTESTVLALINKPPQLQPKVLSQKIAFLSLFFMAFMVLSYYRALLKAALSVRAFKLSINSYKDILDSNLDVLVWKNGAPEDKFRLAAPGSIHRQIYEMKIHNKPGVNEVGGHAESMELVRKGRAVLYGASESRMALPIYPCKVTDIVPLRTKIDMAMPFKKESPFLPSIQKALTELRQNGVIEKVDSDYKQSLKLKEHINCDAGTESLGLTQTFFPFACLVFGAGLAFFAMSLEKRKKMHGNDDEHALTQKIMFARKQKLRKTIYDKTQDCTIKQLETLANSM